MDHDEALRRLDEQRERLMALKADRSEAAELTEEQRNATGELSGDDQHPGDAATETFERTRELSIRDQLDDRIAEVDAARKRVEEGTYGQCTVCGRQIHPDRLELRPEARYCMEHQAEAERRDLAGRTDLDQESVRWD